MNAKAYILALRNLRTQYGEEALLDSRRVRGFLLDAKLPSSGHIHLLVDAVEEGLVQELQRNGATEDPLIGAGLISRMQNKRRRSREDAEWVLLVWQQTFSQSYQADAVVEDVQWQRDEEDLTPPTSPSNNNIKTNLDEDKIRKEKQSGLGKVIDMDAERKKFIADMHRTLQEQKNIMMDGIENTSRHFLTVAKEEKYDPEVKNDIQRINNFLTDNYGNIQDLDQIPPHMATTRIGRAFIARINNDMKYYRMSYEAYKEAEQIMFNKSLCTSEKTLIRHDNCM